MWEVFSSNLDQGTDHRVFFVILVSPSRQEQGQYFD
jgi:hypothetical protein